MGLLHFLPRPALLVRKPKELDPLTEVERNEERLWLLALLLIFLLSVGLFLLSAVDDMRGSGGRAAPLAAPLVAVLGNDITTSFLLVLVLLISAYFRERLIARRAENRRLVESLKAANIALDRRSQQLADWGEMSHALIANYDLPRLLELIVNTAIEVTQAESASVMLFDEERKELYIAAAKGLEIEVVKNTKIRPGEGIAGWVAEKGEPLLLCSKCPDRRFLDRLHQEHVTSAISVPLRVESVVVGTLNVKETYRPEEFNRDDLRSLSVFADQAALALEKAHLYRASQAQLEKMLSLLDELQNTQKQLIHTEKLASLGTLAGGVAHEINNPLMVILGRTELSLMGPGIPDSVKQNLEIVLGETRRIADIVRGLLDFSRRSQVDTFGPVDVNDLIEKTLALTEHQMKTDNTTILREFESELPQLEANGGQLQQVFTNMVINAYHAMPEGGNLTVRTKKSGEDIVIEFEDTGQGIAKENLDHIFDPFFTTKSEGKGTGLGLAVSHTIIERHGGNIGVASEPGYGTCFTIQIPIKGAALSADAEARESSQQTEYKPFLALASKTVML